MIDPEIADKVRASISVGDDVEFLTGPEKWLACFNILEIKSYSFIVGLTLPNGAVQKLELSISKTLEYITETEKMRIKMPPIVATETVTPAPPVPPTQSAVPAFPPFPGAQTPAPVPSALNNPEWVRTELDNALSQFGKNIKLIMEGIVAAAEFAIDAGDAQTPEVHTPDPLTCFDCLFLNVAGNRCDKQNATPPLAVIVSPQNNPVFNCPDFVTDDEIPY